MHSSASTESRISVNSHTIKSFVLLFYKLACYLYLVELSSKLEIIKKHIMAVVMQRLGERTLSTKSVELSSSSDSEDSCGSTDVPEIERGADGLRLSFGKVAQKRNLRDEAGAEEQPRGAKSPTIISCSSSPSLLLASVFDKPPVSVLTDSANKPTSFNNVRPTSDFKLILSSTTSPSSRNDKEEAKGFRSLDSCQKSSCRGIREGRPLPVSSEDLAARLSSDSGRALAVDCRSFMKYNSNHIVGAINACCTNPTIKKRFGDGKIGVLELISGAENKKKFQEVTSSEQCIVVIYDDDSTDVGETGCLSVISARLAILGHRVEFLKGGIKDFMINHSHLCSQPVVIEQRPLLFSPTSPYVDAAIDSTVMTEILPHLCLGNEKDAADMARLEGARITHVLNVSTSIPLFCELQRPGAFKALRLSASDSGSQNIKQYFGQAIDFIEAARKSGGKVLVHCQAGVSRSPTITIAYLMAMFGHSSLDAFSIVKTKRAIVSPNINFMGQLLEFESRLREASNVAGFGKPGGSQEMTESAN